MVTQYKPRAMSFIFTWHNLISLNSHCLICTKYFGRCSLHVKMQTEPGSSLLKTINLLVRIIGYFMWTQCDVNGQKGKGLHAERLVCSSLSPQKPTNKKTLSLATYWALSQLSMVNHKVPHILKPLTKCWYKGSIWKQLIMEQMSKFLKVWYPYIYIF